MMRRWVRRAKSRHERHECAYCGALWRCRPAAELRGIREECKTPYYWPCPECWASQVWKNDERFDKHARAHFQEAWGI